MAVCIVGVRHHSPACAGLVRHVIRQRRPRYVLIEGPADMNARMAELQLPHELPVAIFTYYHGAERTHASWTPFCDYSPEWVALREGAAVGAELRFMDLPAWSRAFAGVRNRYSDSERRYERAVATLCARLGMDGMDALWDHLFEQPLEPEVLAERLTTYFEGLRDKAEVAERDQAREEFMAQCIQWASGQCADDGGDVVVVCGGFHRPALEQLLRRRDETVGAPWPAHPEPQDEGDGESEDQSEHGSFLVPYSFHRLDSFAGYEAGMPSPAFYQALWEHGPASAAERMLRAAVTRLRKRRQQISSADLVAASTMAQGLARLHGHAVLSRCDLLDGLASALLKDAQEVPLPWTERGKLRPGTDPLLVQVVAALSGDRRGTLAAATPRPPLLADVRQQLESHELVPGRRPRSVELQLTDPSALEQSRILHRLRVLGVPGFERDHGPTWATDPILEERWTIQDVLDAESALIEAAAYGATLTAAAVARLEESLLAAEGDVESLTTLLGEAAFVGLERLSDQVLTLIALGVKKEPELGKLGRALSRLLALYRHDALLGAQQSQAIGRIIESAFDRGLWLVEGIQGPTAPADGRHLHAVVALRDAVRFTAAELDVEAERVAAVMERRAVDDAAPPALRGAALGLLWSLGCFADAAAAQEHAASAIRGAARPSTLGDFLAGLFALGREQVLDHVAGDAEPAEGSLVGTLDELVRAMTQDDFLMALPSLRMAHSYFPPRERERIAQRVLALHGRETGLARSLVRTPVDPMQTAAGMALEAQVDELERRYGLVPALDGGSDG